MHPHTPKDLRTHTHTHTHTVTLDTHAHTAEWLDAGCLACPPGQYSAAGGSTACDFCSAGTFSNSLTHSSYRAVESTVTCGGSCGGCFPSSGATSGAFSDGSGYYDNYENCWWLIAAPAGTEIKVSFSHFRTDNGDYVSIYTCDCYDEVYGESQQILRVDGSARPSNVYRSTTGFLKVTFKSDSSGTSSGFEGTWSSAVGGSTACTNCSAPAGHYCPQQSSSPSGITCPPGYSCPGGAEDKLWCPSATSDGWSYCPEPLAITAIQSSASGGIFAEVCPKTPVQSFGEPQYKRCELRWSWTDLYAGHENKSIIFKTGTVGEWTVYLNVSERVTHAVF